MYVYPASPVPTLGKVGLAVMQDTKDYVVLGCRRSDATVLRQPSQATIKCYKSPSKPPAGSSRFKGTSCIQVRLFALSWSRPFDRHLSPRTFAFSHLDLQPAAFLYHFGYAKKILQQGQVSYDCPAEPELRHFRPRACDESQSPWRLQGTPVIMLGVEPEVR